MHFSAFVDLADVFYAPGVNYVSEMCLEGGRDAIQYGFITLSLKRNAPWKVAFLFGKSVDR